ncbi:Ribosomal RNA small subunit methyltransferase B [Morella rubra]|uniref:Ribosomal RNA small subunit methyltransferase B n=1 Tax=Morella rubra TaxID=262757 RepID=A0A6A1WSZ8_9ROSI|nr:Ribosomal RNA small subunit methyltransferase B [Morella rubra]
MGNGVRVNISTQERIGGDDGDPLHRPPGKVSRPELGAQRREEHRHGLEEGFLLPPNWAARLLWRPMEGASTRKRSLGDVDGGSRGTDMAHVLSLRVNLSAAETHKASSKPLKFAKRNRESKTPLYAPRKGSDNPSNKTQKLNLEVSPHRAVSAVRLMRIELGGAFADLLNERGKGSGDNEMGYVERTLGFRTRELDDRDLRLVTDVVGGTIRWRRFLDYLICSICHDEKAFRHMEPLLLQALFLLHTSCFYEIVKLDMPQYAVVDENVRLAKVALRPGAGNMVNGILRKLVLLKENHSLPLPKVEGDQRAQARALATLYSHPVWMVRRWTKYIGQEETIRLMTWNNSDPSFSLRANRGKGVSRADLVTQLNLLKVPHELSSHLDDFVRIKTGLQIVIQSGLLKHGLCSVQDESAGMVVSVVDPQSGERIIDCCAAPGGKTLYMASHLSGWGMVSAIDINKGRLRILKETAELHQVDGVISTIHADLRTFADKHPVKGDKVLLDAPCSGLGVLSKRADLRWNRRLEDMEQLKNLQDELFDAASLLVKPGGVLIYSTCSIDPEENEERVAAFLLRHPEFSIDPVDRYVPPDFATEHVRKCRDLSLLPSIGLIQIQKRWCMRTTIPGHWKDSAGQPSSNACKATKRRSYSSSQLFESGLLNQPEIKREPKAPKSPGSKSYSSWASAWFQSFSCWEMILVLWPHHTVALNSSVGLALQECVIWMSRT